MSAKHKPQPRQKVAAPDVCDACGAKCCRYVAIEIDKPTCKKDYDHIVWYLLHEHIQVFVDHEQSWYVEIKADCARLGPDNRCLDYEARPRICRRYGSGGEVCEHVADTSPYKHLFTRPEAFLTWLNKHGRKHWDY